MAARATTATTAITAEAGAFLPALAIITHDSAADVERNAGAQAALAERLGTRLIVVDNASADRTRELVRELTGDTAVLVAKPSNVGYAAAVNAAFAAAGERDVLLLNPDVAPPAEEQVAALIEFLHANPRAAVVAPRLVDADGATQPSARRFPSLLAMLGSVPALARVAWARRSYEDYQAPSFATEPVTVDWVIGAAMLIRRSAYDEVGGWDERFFLYMEDADFCRRLARAGWEVWLFPAIETAHGYARASTTGGSIARSRARRHHVVSLARFFAREPRMLFGGGRR